MAEAYETISGTDLGALLGLHERQVRKLAERGVINRPTRGRYDPAAAIRAYCDHLREQAAGRAAAPVGGETPDLVGERALLAREQREHQAMKNAVLRNELLPIDAVEEVVGAVLDATRTKHLALPTKAAPLLVGAKTQAEIREVLTRLVHDALNDLAATPVVVATAADRARGRLGRAAGDPPPAAPETATTAYRQPVG